MNNDEYGLKISVFEGIKISSVIDGNKSEHFLDESYEFLPKKDEYVISDLATATMRTLIQKMGEDKSSIENSVDVLIDNMYGVPIPEEIIGSLAMTAISFTVAIQELNDDGNTYIYPSLTYPDGYSIKNKDLKSIRELSKKRQG